MINIKQENINIPVDSGKINLKGSIYYSKNTPSKAPWVINIAGLLDTRESPFVKNYSERFAREGFYVLTYDHRGHGETIKETGKLKYMKWMPLIYADVSKAINWIITEQSERLLEDKIILFGRSLGGAIILTQGFTDKRAKLLIALCTRYDYAKYTTITFPEETILKISPRYFLNVDPSNNTRILIAHCKDDPRIPFENVMHIKEKLDLNDENVIIYETGGHSFKGHRDDIFKQSINFLKRHL